LVKNSDKIKSITPMHKNLSAQISLLNIMFEMIFKPFCNFC